jgi:hypothetical protein
MAFSATSRGTPSSSNIMRPGFTTATHASGDPLPFPIRVSAGFFVIGLSGKMRIQILPPRLMLRLIATRHASIWRLVTQPGSCACSPKCPNETSEPRYAVPVVRPLNILRNLTRLGLSIGQAPLSSRSSTWRPRGGPPRPRP